MKRIILITFLICCFIPIGYSQTNVGTKLSDITNNNPFATSTRVYTADGTNGGFTTLGEIADNPIAQSNTENALVWISESNLYYFASNPSGYVDQTITNGYWHTNSITNWVISQAYLTSFTESDPIWAGVSSLYYFASNPDGFITNEAAFTNWLTTNTYIQVESDPIWAVESNQYYLTSNPLGFLTVETDPVWVGVSSLYYFASNPSGYVDQTITNGYWHTNDITNWVISQSYLTTESDPIWATTIASNTVNTTNNAANITNNIADIAALTFATNIFPYSIDIATNTYPYYFLETVEGKTLIQIDGSCFSGTTDAQLVISDISGPQSVFSVLTSLRITPSSTTQHVETIVIPPTNRVGIFTVTNTPGGVSNSLYQFYFAESP